MKKYRQENKEVMLWLKEKQIFSSYPKAGELKALFKNTDLKT